MVDARRGDLWDKAEEIIDLYVNQRKIPDEIGKIYNVTGHTIRAILRTNKVNVKNVPGSDKRADIWENADEIVDLYVNKNVSTIEIARLYDTNRTTIVQVLKSKNVRVIDRRKGTSIEEKVEKWLKKYKIAYQKQFTIERKRYDFAISDTNILIEVQGTFWHVDPRFYDRDNLTNDIQILAVEKDKLKEKLAIKNGYQLVYLWEHDINSVPYVIEKYIEQIKSLYKEK